MSNISTTLNLAALKHTVMSMKSSQSGMIDCIVIPIDQNMLYRGEKGLYLSLIGFDLKDPNEQKTHMIKQSFKKEYLDSLSDDEKKSLPIFGNHIVFGQKQTE